MATWPPLDASYSYLRQFTSAVLSSVRFAGGTAATELLIAVQMLRELNATGGRKVFDDAPTGFVPAKDGLRSGDMYVPGSRHYADPAAYLLTSEQWEPQGAEF